MEKYLHIVCLDVPWPANYGGAIEMFFKIKSLHQLGIKIYLHCFEYGRGKQPELEKYCVEVHYYNRNRGHKGFSNCIPYIVSSRSSEQLIQRLLQDDYPILLDGIHCTWPLHAGKLANRKVFLRSYNVEYEYYYHLFRHERSVFKKIFFYNESRLLKRYEARIVNKLPVIALTEKDVTTYRKKFSASAVSYLPVFIPFQQIESLPGLGTYCLYHGNLSVAENEKAVTWLLKEIFYKLKLPFIIAGKNPSSRLQRLAHKHCHICLIENPDEEQMKDLIAKAQINILPSFNGTGIKLKLLNALYNGRHCIVNEAAVKQTGLEDVCHVVSTPGSFQDLILQLYRLPFGDEEIKQRQKLLLENYDNIKNASRLIEWIW